MEDPPPPESCFFGATKQQTFALRAVIAIILSITFFAIAMTDDHTLRFVLCIIGIVLALLSLITGVLILKYFQTPRHIVLDDCIL